MNDIDIKELKFRLDNDMLSVFSYAEDDRDIKARIHAKLKYIVKRIDYYLLYISFKNVDDHEKYSNYEDYDMSICYTIKNNILQCDLLYNLSYTSVFDYTAYEYDNVKSLLLSYKNILKLDLETIKFLDIQNYSKETKSDFRKVKINKMLNDK